jgi:hypothetical protein
MTESWLGLSQHRRGLGTEARAALLHLAFFPVGGKKSSSGALRWWHRTRGG